MVEALGGKRKIPHLGSRCDDIDDEMDRIETFFVDVSGFGGSGEMALTQDQLKLRLAGLVGMHGEIYVALEEVGEFQGHVAVWKKQ